MTRGDSPSESPRATIPGAYPHGSGGDLSRPVVTLGGTSLLRSASDTNFGYRESPEEDEMDRGRLSGRVEPADAGLHAGAVESVLVEGRPLGAPVATRREAAPS